MSETGKNRALQHRADLGRTAADDAIGSGAIPTADLTSASQPTSQTAVAYPAEAGITSSPDPYRERKPGLRHMSRMMLYRRRFMRNRFAVVGVIIFVLLILLAIIGPYLSKWSYYEADFLALSEAPGPEHWFGTSEAGNDLFAQVTHGLGRSLIIAVTVSISVTFLSAVIGAGAALYGGAVEKIILTIIHFLLAVPTFLIIALLVSDSGGDWKLLTVVLIAFGWFYPARVIWSLALSVRENDYVRAAKYMGVSRPRTILRHIVPNIGSLLVIQLALSVVSTVMSETGLSFLGLGVKLPDVSLGTLLSQGANQLESAPWMFWFPAGVLTLLTVSMAFIADGLRDALDPNSNAGGKA
ncbi:ABC transporter permease subunit [Corynebacterium poyangense]|uniref:Oligopeptide transport system permease protein OppC n=1 Tax=Corynebacterium poyangense TaxID=2684405 RepID=A0A7H0SPF2_9CORY|nr:ABC transporter permease [Corynebacterium poyangense]QNQ90427.1 ABC transporter permease subunit [Corynebacterium poyangense]